MAIENPSTSPSKSCPTCGTRAALDAHKCLVCGTDFVEKKSKTSKSQEASLRGSRMPELTLSVPLIIILLAIFMLLGGGLVFYGLSATDNIAPPTVEPTDTSVPTTTQTATPQTPTTTFTSLPSPTPFSYTVQANDSCGDIALAFNISVRSLILENSLSSSCSLLIGDLLKIPQPTATPSPIATSTLSSAEATVQACPTQIITVQQNDTLSSISANTGVPVGAIMEWNGKTTDVAFTGETLSIPLCFREIVFGVGTVTPSPAPPYPAPELLLPNNGAFFNLDQDTVSLQWASVGTLRDNEFYQIRIVDITSGENIQLIAEVTDTKFIVPSTFRPDNEFHTFKWSVVTVAQVGVDEEGSPILIPGGAESEGWIFSWSGESTGTDS